MAPFLQESDSLRVHVQSGTHPIAALRRGHHGRGLVEVQSTGAPKRVADDLGLQLQLTSVGHVRERASAAPGHANDRPPIGAGLQHLHRLRQQHVSLGVLDHDAYVFAWDRARHQHDTALMAGQHAAPNHGSLHRHVEDGAARGARGGVADVGHAGLVDPNGRQSETLA